MNPSEELKKRCICNYGSCESDVSITVSLDNLNLIISSVKNQLDNAIFCLRNSDMKHPNRNMDIDIKLAKDIERMEMLLDDLEKLRK